MNRPTNKPPKKKRKNLEHIEQIQVVEWARFHEDVYRCLKLLYSVPNGGKRDIVTASTLKREGLRAGIPDLVLPAARGGYHGFYLEMKAGNGKTSEAQNEIIAGLQQEGYYVAAHWTAKSAITEMINYLNNEVIKC